MPQRTQWLFLCGIGEYADHVGLQALPGVIDDLHRLSHCLDENPAYAVGAVVILEDMQATRTAVLEKLRQLALHARHGDQLVVYLAGHAVGVAGGPVPSAVDGRTTYFLPYDATRAEAAARGISPSDLADVLRNTSASQIVLLMDCCRSTGFAASPPALAALDLAARDCFVGLTCGPTEAVADFPSGGVFMKHFCDALEGRNCPLPPDRSMTVQAAFEHARQQAEAELHGLRIEQRFKHVASNAPIMLTAPARSHEFVRPTPLLLVEDDADYGQALHAFLSHNGYKVTPHRDLHSIDWVAIRRSPPEVVICDLFLGRDDAHGAGLAAVQLLRKHAPLCQVLILSGHTHDLDVVVSAVKAGAIDVMSKAPNPSDRQFQRELLRKLDKLKEQRSTIPVDRLRHVIREWSAEDILARVLTPLYQAEAETIVQRGQAADGRPSVPWLWIVKPDPFTRHPDVYGVLCVTGDLQRGAPPDAGLSAADVMTMADQVLARTYTDPRTGEPLRPRAVLIYATGTVSAGARAYVEEQAQTRRHLRLIELDNLIQMLVAAGLVDRIVKSNIFDKLTVFLVDVVAARPEATTWFDVVNFIREHLAGLGFRTTSAYFHEAQEVFFLHPMIHSPGVADGHMYNVGIDANFLVAAHSATPLAWSSKYKEEIQKVHLAVITLLAGDRRTDHAHAMRTIRQELVPTVSESGTQGRAEGAAAFELIRRYLNRACSEAGIEVAYHQPIRLNV